MSEGRMTYEFRIQVDIHDTEFLRKAAEARYVSENLDPMEFNKDRARERLLREWAELRACNLDPVAADLHMVLDPGSAVLGDGGEIVQTEAEDITQ